ncbi:hypothetical protein H6F50_09090 [Coleofasciculus sp. FACHB-712]|uniref:hypothetical protein n=1 Tax=Coleofasciculus sp. FACHB-712 TaxID=2692789 RepID=UPI001682C67B|nr:hypothetical protein [Coleofasciculus sp. FACHB-712]MBD1942508.1 hypothetical protein [Coleofasciculus sp. FACHB-712]
MEAQTAVEGDLNAKIQELEKHNQELGGQLEAVKKELVDVETERENVRHTLDAVNLNLSNLKTESVSNEVELERLGTENAALRQELEAIASPIPEETIPSAITDVAVGGDVEVEKLSEAIAFPATASPQEVIKTKTAKKPRNPVEIPNKDVITSMLDKPCCVQCGECEKIGVNTKLVLKPGKPGEADSYSQRWECKKCKKTWTRKAEVAAELTTTSL